MFTSRWMTVVFSPTSLHLSCCHVPASPLLSSDTLLSSQAFAAVGQSCFFFGFVVVKRCSSFGVVNLAQKNEDTSQQDSMLLFFIHHHRQPIVLLPKPPCRHAIASACRHRQDHAQKTETEDTTQQGSTLLFFIHLELPRQQLVVFLSWPLVITPSSGRTAIVKKDHGHKTKTEDKGRILTRLDVVVHHSLGAVCYIPLLRGTIIVQNVCQEGWINSAEDQSLFQLRDANIEFL